jgi:hypothetical protein
MTDERLRLESPIFPLILTVALLIEYQQYRGAIYILPFTSEDMAVTGLRLCRWKSGIHGNWAMDCRLDASRREQ